MTQMELSMVYNVGSIALGLCAWLVAGWSAARYKPWKTAASYLFCAAALLLQLFEVKNRAFAGDYAAIEDTIRVIVFVGIFMLFVTVILNIFAFFKCRIARRKAKKEAAN